MNLFVWTEALATGNAFIDAEHHALVERVNGVLESIAERSDGTLLGQAMERLMAYSQAHFSREEQEMLRIGYPDLAPHRAAHSALLEQLQAMQATLVDAQTPKKMELYRFLTWWVKDHIHDFDQKLAIALAPQD